MIEALVEFLVFKIFSKYNLKYPIWIRIKKKKKKPVCHFEQVDFDMSNYNIS